MELLAIMVLLGAFAGRFVSRIAGRLGLPALFAAILILSSAGLSMVIHLMLTTHEQDYSYSLSTGHAIGCLLGFVLATADEVRQRSLRASGKRRHQ
ncbi:MAG TPA: hypothetical protein VMB73_07140 [Acetobacteraceae bacterium]|nr:hypothetical protein [Acetobacteraceae bacterium]